MARVSGFHCARAKNSLTRILLLDSLFPNPIAFRQKPLACDARVPERPAMIKNEWREKEGEAQTPFVAYPASIRFPRSPGTPLRSRPLNRLSRIPSTRRAAPIPIGGRRGRPRHESGASANRWRRASRRRNLSARGSLEES